MNKSNKTDLQNRNGSKSASGITLIALIVTIIVLLILAGVAIATLFSDNGIINRTISAKNSTDIAGAKERTELYAQEFGIDFRTQNLAEGSTATTLSGYILEQINGKDALGHSITSSGTHVTLSKDGQVTATGTVNDNGTLTWGDTAQTGGGNTTQGTTLAIGDSVNYVTSLNGVTLDNWKVFYVDGDYTYLIYGGNLPKSAINTTSISGLSNNDDWDEYGIYVPDNSNRTNLLNIMTTKSNWDSLLSGTLNGHTIAEKRSENVWAMGSPDLTLWVNSWNASYPSDTLYTRYISLGDIDNNHFNAEGYAIDEITPVMNYRVNLSNKSGYNNALYFTFQDDVYGYWLADTSCESIEALVIVNWDESPHGLDRCCYSCNGITMRPVIKLPTNVVNQ